MSSTQPNSDLTDTNLGTRDTELNEGTELALHLPPSITGQIRHLKALKGESSWIKSCTKTTNDGPPNMHA